MAHTVEGLGQLVAFTQRLTPPSEQVVCVVETNQGLLVNALLEAGLVVCPVNPTTLSRYRPLSGVKTDRLDATLLARVGRMQWPALPILQPDSPQLQELKTLTRDLQGRIVEQTRLVNQLTACLKAYFPLALELFDGLQRRVTLAFLQAFPATLSRRGQRRWRRSQRCSAASNIPTPPPKLGRSTWHCTVRNWRRRRGRCAPSRA